MDSIQIALFNIIIFQLSNVSGGLSINKELVNDTNITKKEGPKFLNCTHHIPLEYYDLVPWHRIDQFRYDLLYACISHSQYHKGITSFYFSEPQVNFSFALNELRALDFKGRIEISATIRLFWNESRLMWDTNETQTPPLLRSGNINNFGQEARAEKIQWKWPEVIELPAYFIWSPRLTLLNCDGKENCHFRVDNDSVVRLTHDGGVKMEATNIFSATCSLDLEYFPYDIQICELKFFISNTELSVPFIKLNRSFAFYMEESEEWLVSSVNVFADDLDLYTLRMKTPNRWDQSAIRFINNCFHIKITAVRMPSYYLLTIVFPVLIILLMGATSYIVPFGNELHSDILINVVLAFIFMETIISNLFPKCRKVPRFQYFIMFALFLSTCKLVLFYLVYRLRLRQASCIPPLWLRLLFIRLPKMICRKLKRTKRDLSHSNVEVKKCPSSCEIQSENAIVLPPKIARLIRPESWEVIAIRIGWFLGLILLFLNFLNIVFFLLPVMARGLWNSQTKEYFQKTGKLRILNGYELESEL